MKKLCSCLYTFINCKIGITAMKCISKASHWENNNVNVHQWYIPVDHVIPLFNTKPGQLNTYVQDDAKFGA